MGCSSCGAKRQVKIEQPEKKVSVKYTARAVQPVSGVVVPRSTTNERVKLRYYGGGMSKKVSSGCSTCRGGKTAYAVTTSEVIMFVSEDAPNGIFKEKFSVGHNYYVTRAQADYLLKLKYRDVAGKEQPKFKEVND